MVFQRRYVQSLEMECESWLKSCPLNLSMGYCNLIVQSPVQSSKEKDCGRNQMLRVGFSQLGEAVGVTGFTRWGAVFLPTLSLEDT